MSERWLPVPGFRRFYEVSSLGRVRSADRYCGARNGGKALRKGRVLRPVTKFRKEYLAVTLTKPGVRHQFLVHDLVALAFLGRKPATKQVCHGAEGPTVNAVRNLRYGTPTENNADRYLRSREIARGEAHGMAKLTEDDVRAIRSSPMSCEVLGRQFGVTEAHIYAVLRRKAWRHI